MTKDSMIDFISLRLFNSCFRLEMDQANLVKGNHSLQINLWAVQFIFLNSIILHYILLYMMWRCRTWNSSKHQRDRWWRYRIVNVCHVGSGSNGNELLHSCRDTKKRERPPQVN